MANGNNPLSNNGLAANLLPSYYQTDTNKKFIQSTIDQLFQSGSVQKISGYIGRHNAKSATGADVYVRAVDPSRRNYQLEPGLTIKDDLGNTTFFKDYIDYINQIGTFGGNTANHANINKQEFYSWDPHIDWDKFVNFQNYYWLPYGPETIKIYGQQAAINSTYTVTVETELSNNEFLFTPDGLTRNPVLKLFIGQTYKFEINSPGNPFSIKTARSAGKNDRYENSGIDNAGVEVGTITFTVPYDAPSLLYYQSETDLQLGGAIEILPITADTYIDISKDLLGKKHYTLPDGTSLSNGMKIAFGGNVTPAQYAKGEYYVEGVGVAIHLVSTKTLEVINAYTVEQTVPFDSDKFDSGPFSDATGFAGNLDYITIDRSSRDYNSWSRYNRWFHKDVIAASAKYNGSVASLDQNSRAVRPIIEFEPNLRLFNFGTNAIQDVNLFDNFTADAFSTVEGSAGYNIDGVPLTQGQYVIFTADKDPLVQNKIFQVNFVNVLHLNSGSEQIHLAEVATPQLNDVVLITSGVKSQGVSYWFNGTTWVKGQQKTTINQTPLFDIVDSDGVSYGDTNVYNGSTFAGTKIFSYQTGTGANDSVLGFPLSYLNINNIGDILFSFNLSTDTFNYKDSTAIIKNNISTGYLTSLTYGGKTVYKNGWQVCTTTTVQAAVRIYNNSGLTNNFNVDIFDDITNLSDLVVKVYVNGYRLDSSLWTLVAGAKYYRVVLTTAIKSTDILTIRAFASQPINSKGYYEIPLNLQNNPMNDAMDAFSLGEVTDHLTSIVDNIPLGFVGSMPGDNNLRDLGNVTQYGTKFVQHSGPLSLGLYHITSESHNIIRAVQQARNDYGSFKRNFIATASSLGVDGDPITITNLVLQKLNSNKPNTAPYYFSDMVPYGASIVTPLNVVDYRIKQYPLSAPFSLDKLSNKAVGIYQTHNGVTTQLVYGRDYTFSSTFVVINDSVKLYNGDVITTYEYDSTDGCFTPETPTKMGMWPAFVPQIYTDTTLIYPQKMIQGHDGSLVLAYGDYRDDLILELEKRIFNNIKVRYNPEIFDIADVIPNYNRNTDYSLQEFNNVLAPNFYTWVTLTGEDFTTPLNYDINNTFTYNYSTSSAPDGTSVPGYWRGIYRYMLDTDRPNLCPWEILGFSIMPSWWVGLYGPAPYTRDNIPMWQDIANGTIREPGVPVVYLSKYAKPFLMNHIPVDSDGKLLSPLECGLAVGPITPSIDNNFVFGDISPVENAWRRGSYYPYSVIIASMLLTPAKTFGLLLDRSRIKRNLANQLVYSNTGLRIRPEDILVPSIYTSNTRVQTSGLINFVVDYILNFIFSNNIKSYNGYSYDLKNLTSKLSYRAGAFTSKEQFNLLLDSRSPLSTGSIFVPQENYTVILNSSSPVKKITYSGVIITKLNAGYEVKGYSKTEPYFYYYPYTGTGQIINVGGISEGYTQWTPGQYYITGSVVQYQGSYFRSTVTHTAGATFDTVIFAALASLPMIGGVQANLRTSWDTSHPILVPYATQFDSIQAVVDFLLGYGKYLEKQGFIFNDFNNSLETVENWVTSVNEFLFWTTQNWSAGANKWSDWIPNQPVTYGSVVRYQGSYYSALFNLAANDIFDPLKYTKLDGLSELGSSVISLSPGANRLVFGTHLTVVDDIANPFYDYEIVKVDGTSINPSFLNSYRNGNVITYTSTNDGIYGATFYLIQNEQVIILDNSTIFNDVIYSPTSGYRQERLKVSAYISTNWYGGLDIPGFIYDRAETQSWEPFQDYNLGDIISYQGNYYSANSFIPGVAIFNATSWTKLSKKPTAQILPNWTNSATQFVDFYSTDVDSFNNSHQIQAHHLIGYQKRQYLDNIIQDSVSEFKFYQGMIRDKGTQNALNHLFGVLSEDNLESLTFYEEWAVRTGQYGASNAFDEIEFILDEAKFISNPQGFNLSTVIDPALDKTFIIQQRPTDVYLTPLGYNSQPWPVVDTYTPLLRAAGYVNPSDVFVALGKLSEITSQDITKFNEGAYVWVTFDNAPNFWNVYRYTDLHLQVISVAYTAGASATTPGKLTITLENIVSNITVGSYIGLTQVSQVQGFYLVTGVSLNVITCAAIVKSFPSPFTPALCEELVVYALVSQRTDSIDNIDKIVKPVKPSELVWTDDIGNGTWAVWQYNPAYKLSTVNNNAPQTNLKFGSSVAVNSIATLAAVTTSFGQVVVYDKAGQKAPWTQRQVVSPPLISKNIISTTSVATTINSILAVCSAAQTGWIGSLISGPGIPSNTIIQSVIPNVSITLGQPATSSNTGGTYTIITNINLSNSIATTVALSSDGTWLASGSPTAGYAITAYLGTYDPNKIYGPGTIVSLISGNITKYYQALQVVDTNHSPLTNLDSWGNLYYVPVNNYGTWNPQTTYKPGTLVVYKSNVYQATETIYKEISLLITSTLASYTDSLNIVHQNVLTTTDTSQLSVGYSVVFTGDVFGDLIITGANGTGSFITLNFATQVIPPFVAGTSITVTGMIPVSYNGTYTVFSCTNNSVSFSGTATGVLESSGHITSLTGSISRLVAGFTYYIANIIDSKHFQISTSRNSPTYLQVFTAYGTMIGTQQPQFSPDVGTNPLTGVPQWAQVTNSYPTIVGPAGQGAVSLYQKDPNNIYSLVDTIVSPLPTANENFGASLVFGGNNALYITAPGYSNSTGRVYSLTYGTIIQKTSAYNPAGSAESTLAVSNTAGIRTGMTVIGTGFTSGQLVESVVDSTSLLLSGTPDSTPSGILSFAITGWEYNWSQMFTGTIGQGFGYSIALSADQSTLAISATNGVSNATVTIYKNTNGVFTQFNTPIITADSNIQLAISDSGTYLAIADDTVNASQLAGRGSVTIYSQGTNSYTQYQTLTLYKPEINGHFGRKISFMNDYKTLVVFSEYGDTQVTTTFDSSLTTFDKDSTAFSVTQNNSGRIDIYDRYATQWVYGESLTKVNPVVQAGSFVQGDTYAILSIGTTDFTKIGASSNTVGILFTATANGYGTGTAAIPTNESGVADSYGTGFAVGANHILVGAPNGIDRSLQSGLVFDYEKLPNQYSWQINRAEIAIPDVTKVKKAFLYDRVGGDLLTYIDVIDPLQGKIPGPAEEEITYKAFYDPAVYTYVDSNSTVEVNVNANASWTTAPLGQLWWDLRTAKFLNVYVNDPVYRNSSWNSLAAGASIDIYEWVSYNQMPSAWDKIADTPLGLASGISGTSLYGNNAYSFSQTFNSVTGQFTKTYYFWVKNKRYIPDNSGRHLDALNVSNLIANPRGQGYTYLALTGTNSFSLVNAKQFLQDTKVVLSVHYWLIENTDQNVHRHWKLISDDPNTKIPPSILQKWIDSLCGVDAQGRIVPDPALPIKLRYGIENRPRQGMFVNRFEALKEFADIANKTLLANQIVESCDLSALESYDPVPNAILGMYDVTFAIDADLPYATVANYAVPSLTPVIGNGRIIGATIVSSGKGYLQAPYIEVNGSGTGAVVQSIINTKGQITGVKVISPGVGYDNATTFSVRNYSALVTSDSQAGGNWSIYSYDPVYKVWSRTVTQSYDVRKFWNYADWYGSYVDPTTGNTVTATQFTAPDFSVSTLADLSSISVAIGEIVKVRTVGAGGWILLYKYATSTSVDWTQSYHTVGIQNGTIQLSPSLYNTSGTILGFDNSTYDAEGFDQYAAVELRIILKTLQNNIFINTLITSYLDIFFDSIRYIHSEQPYVDWIFKTSFVKAEHNVGSLTQPVTYQPDNLSNFQDYVNEVKPYRTKVREYVDNYKNLDVGQLPITDFDLQPIYENSKMTVLNAYYENDQIVTPDSNIQNYPWKFWLDNVGFTVTELILTSNGSGYVSNPVVKITSSSGSGATARAFITNGSVNRIVLLTHGSGYLSKPTVTIEGGLGPHGVAATATSIIGNSVVRSTLLGMKFDRVDSSYYITQLQKIETFTGTANRVQFPLTWGPDVRVGKSTVTVNGILALRDSYVLSIVSSTTKGYTQYSGNITFTTAPAVGAKISVTYIVDQSLLGATDRIQYYYSPTAGMPGQDLSQLLTGIDYGGVIVNGMNFVESSGWDSVPYYSTGWDASDSTYTDYAIVVNANTHAFTLPYTPSVGTQLNIYKTQSYTNSYVSNGSTSSYQFNVTDLPPVVTASWTTATAGVSTNFVSINTLPGGQYGTTLTVINTAGITAGMAIIGTGFTQGQIVSTVVNGTVLTLSNSPDAAPVGTMTFTKNVISSSTLTVTNSSGIKAGDIITGGNGAFVSGTTVVSVLNSTTVTLNHMLYKIIPNGTSVTFTRTLTLSIDYIIPIAGTLKLINFKNSNIISNTTVHVTGVLNPLRLDDLNYNISSYITQLINAIAYDTVFGSNLQSIQVGNAILLAVTSNSYKPSEAILSINNVIKTITNLSSIKSNSTAVSTINTYAGIITSIVNGGIVPTFVYPSPYGTPTVISYNVPNIQTVDFYHVYIPVTSVSSTPVTTGWTVTGPGITGVATVITVEVIPSNGLIAAKVDLRVAEFIENGIYTFQTPNGGITNAAILLNDNIPFIQAEMIAYITANYPSVTYNTNLFQTQIQYTVESLVYDVLYGGNSQTLYTATLAPAIGFTSNPSNWTAYWTDVYSYLNSLVQSIILNTVVTPLQTAFFQYTNSNLVHGGITSTTVSNNIASIVKYLTNVTVTTVTPTVTLGVSTLQSTANTILAAKSTLIPVYNSTAVVNTFLADGINNTFYIPNTYTVIDGDEFIIRQTTSDGSIVPPESDYDTALTGGDTTSLNGVYSTATGLLADDIIVDGDDFVTPDTSGAPEEVVPGQVVDTVAIKVFNIPNSGSAKIHVDNYITDGTTSTYALSQVPNSPGAVIVKLNGNIKTLNVDYVVNYNTQSNKQTVVLNAVPGANQQLSLFTIGYNGNNILGIDYFIGDGSTTEFVTNIKWQSPATSLVYVNGVVATPVLFRTDSTYSVVDVIGLRFAVPPTSGQVINYIIVSGTQQEFSIASVETIATNGSLSYTLKNQIGNSLPSESNMLVRVDQTILQAPNNSYFTIGNNRLNYSIDSTKFTPYTVPITSIFVIVGNVTLSLGTDYTVDLSGITIKINKQVYSKYKGQTLIVSVTLGETYTYNPSTQQITFTTAYDNTHLVQVVSFYQHDILDIERTEINVSNNANLVVNTPSYFEYQNITGKIVPLDRYVIDQNYVWATLSGTLLTPSVDYKLNADHLSLTLSNSLIIDSTTVLSIITFGSTTLLPGVAYMQFKDMLNRVSYKRLSSNKQTTLAHDLLWSDTQIVVTDASKLDLPNPARSKPGVIEIVGERIEYYQVSGNTLSQLRRSTLGTGMRTFYIAGSFVQDIGTSSTIPYVDTQLTNQFISDGTSVISLPFIPSSVNDVEVFVGGYNDGAEWASGVSYSVGTIVNQGPYTYRCTVAHTSTDTFFNDITNWKFFIGNTRLKKVGYTVFNINNAPYSPAGDVKFDPDFTIPSVKYSSAKTWTSNTVVQLNQYILYNNNYYQVTNGGTFSGNLTGNNTTITNISSVAGLGVGDLVFGTGIVTGTIISAISTHSITISNPAKSTIVNNTLTYSKSTSTIAPTHTTGSALNGSANLLFIVNAASLILTNLLTPGTQITVIKNTGVAWDGNKNNQSQIDILYDPGVVGEFLRAEPGISYNEYNKLGTNQVSNTSAVTFDNGNGTFDSGNITFDRG